jgi:hypothetical protein
MAKVSDLRDPELAFGAFSIELVGLKDLQVLL